MVVPRFVEIVTISFEFTFLKTMRAGAIATMDKERARNKAADFFPNLATAQSKKITAANAISRGCISVASISASAAKIDSRVTSRFLPLLKYRSIKAIAIKSNEAVGISYPIAIVFRASVGLRVRMQT
jgi:hypothetical protein